MMSANTIRKLSWNKRSGLNAWLLFQATTRIVTGRIEQNRDQPIEKRWLGNLQRRLRGNRYSRIL